MQGAAWEKYGAKQQKNSCCGDEDFIVLYTYFLSISLITTTEKLTKLHKHTCILKICFLPIQTIGDGEEPSV